MQPLPDETVKHLLFGENTPDLQRVLCGYYVLKCVNLERNSGTSLPLFKTLKSIASTIPFRFILDAAKVAGAIYPELISLIAVEFPHHFEPYLMLSIQTDEVGIKSHPSKNGEMTNVLHRAEILEWTDLFCQLQFPHISEAQANEMRMMWYKNYMHFPIEVSTKTMNSLSPTTRNLNGSSIEDLLDPVAIIEKSKKLLCNESFCGIGLQILRCGFITFKNNRNSLESNAYSEITNHNCLEILALFNFLTETNPSKVIVARILRHVHGIFLRNTSALHKVHEIQYPIPLIQNCVRYIPSMRSTLLIRHDNRYDTSFGKFRKRGHYSFWDNFRFAIGSKISARKHRTNHSACFAGNQKVLE